MSLEMLGDANAMTVLAVALAAALLICGAISTHRINRLRVRLRPYLHTFETASVGITHVTLDGRWIRVNEKMAELTGYTREELTTLAMLFDTGAKIEGAQLGNAILSRPPLRDAGSRNPCHRQTPRSAVR